MKTPEYIMIHHSAVSYKKNRDQFRANNSYHRKLWNFRSSLGYYLGYNYEIAKNGKVRQARADGETTAACYQDGMNNGKCIHICLDGNFDQEKYTAPQLFAVRDLLKSLISKYNIKDIIAHRDYANKSCPGMNVDIGYFKKVAGFKKEEPISSPPEQSNAEIIKQIIELLTKLK